MSNMEVISQKKEPSWILSEGRHSHAFWVRSVAVYLLFYRCSVWHTGHFCSSEMPGNSWANPAPLHWTHVWNSPCFPTKLQAGCSMHPTSRVTETSQPYGNQHAWKAACHSIRWFIPCAGYYPCRSMSSNPQAHLHLLYSDPWCSCFQSGCPCRLQSPLWHDYWGFIPLWLPTVPGVSFGRSQKPDLLLGKQSWRALGTQWSWGFAAVSVGLGVLSAGTRDVLL